MQFSKRFSIHNAPIHTEHFEWLFKSVVDTGHNTSQHLKHESWMSWAMVEQNYEKFFKKKHWVMDWTVAPSQECLSKSMDFECSKVFRCWVLWLAIFCFFRRICCNLKKKKETNRNYVIWFDIVWLLVTKHTEHRTHLALNS